MPARATASYDVRTVINDVLDEHSFLELRPAYAPNMVTGLGRLGGRPVGIVANQPMFRAGTLDIEASRKAARFVQWCDAFNFPIITFVDTPGFEPGRDLEWRGMIRHGAELVHAYAAATVPRLCVAAAQGLRRRVHRHGLEEPRQRLVHRVADGRDRGDGRAGRGADPLPPRPRGRSPTTPSGAREQLALEAEYAERFANPYVAAERGYVDDVIAAVDTRRVLADALAAARHEA